jgi:predicted TIM-barrel fold metal-dependent hydrolase
MATTAHTNEAEGAGPGPEIPLGSYRPRSMLALEPTEISWPAAPVIDAHNHLGRWLTPWVRPEGGWMVTDVPALLALMDELQVRTVVNLDGRWDDELEENLDRYDRAHPRRFATFCQVDWSQVANGRGANGLIASLERSRASGARGLKVWKDLGLGIRDNDGVLVLPDDGRVVAVFEAAGELGLPVMIHTADPVAFFEPLDASNERLEELAVHQEWAAHGPEYPPFERLIESLEALVAACPRTTFVAVHVGCYAENLGWVSRMLDTYPNLNIDISARISELGRQPRAARALFDRHPERILFGTDELPPSREQYLTYFRFLETEDEYFPYSPDPGNPYPRGRWHISGLGLDHAALPAIYRDNALRVLGL